MKPFPFASTVKLGSNTISCENFTFSYASALIVIPPSTPLEQTLLVVLTVSPINEN
jgi:hypothetical protein